EVGADLVEEIVTGSWVAGCLIYFVQHAGSGLIATGKGPTGTGEAGRGAGGDRKGPRSARILARNSSATRWASMPLRMICGRMKIMSSVRWRFPRLSENNTPSPGT